MLEVKVGIRKYLESPIKYILVFFQCKHIQPCTAPSECFILQGNSNFVVVMVVALKLLYPCL